MSCKSCCGDSGSAATSGGGATFWKLANWSAEDGVLTLARAGVGVNFWTETYNLQTLSTVGGASFAPNKYGCAANCGPLVLEYVLAFQSGSAPTSSGTILRIDRGGAASSIYPSEQRIMPPAESQGFFGAVPLNAPFLGLMLINTDTSNGATIVGHIRLRTA